MNKKNFKQQEKINIFKLSIDDLDTQIKLKEKELKILGAGKNISNKNNKNNKMNNNNNQSMKTIHLNNNKNLVSYSNYKNSPIINKKKKSPNAKIQNDKRSKTPDKTGTLGATISYKIKKKIKF